MDQCNQQQQLSINKCASATDDEEEEIEDDNDGKADDEDVGEINQEPEISESNNKRRSSKWKPVWPEFNCLDCCGFCYFFYLLFGCDKQNDQISPSADETIESTSSLFDYAVVLNQRPRRPTQMNIPLEVEVTKKDSIVSSATINDNNDQL